MAADLITGSVPTIVPFGEVLGAEEIAADVQSSIVRFNGNMATWAFDLPSGLRAGTLHLLGSMDGLSWHSTDSVTITASVALVESRTKINIGGFAFLMVWVDQSATGGPITAQIGAPVVRV